jgi:hypothetical protein
MLLPPQVVLHRPLLAAATTYHNAADSSEDRCFAEEMMGGNIKSLDAIPIASSDQVTLGRRLGIDFSGKTVSVAWAMIEDVIQKEFWGNTTLGSPTQKQIELAFKFGYDISTLSKRVGTAIIGDIMRQLNLEAIAEQKLEPGMVVTNKYDVLATRMVISSIAEDGTVFFRGGNGRHAWARNLCKVEESRGDVGLD